MRSSSAPRSCSSRTGHAAPGPPARAGGIWKPTARVRPKTGQIVDRKPTLVYPGGNKSRFYFAGIAMSTTEKPPLPRRTLKDIGIHESKHPTWMNAFQEDHRSDQLHEDHSAWYGVTGLLLTIIITGVSLAIMTVVLCLAAV